MLFFPLMVKGFISISKLLNQVSKICMTSFFSAISSAYMTEKTVKCLYVNAITYGQKIEQKIRTIIHRYLNFNYVIIKCSRVT